MASEVMNCSSLHGSLLLTTKHPKIQWFKTTVISYCFSICRASGSGLAYLDSYFRSRLLNNSASNYTSVGWGGWLCSIVPHAPCTSVLENKCLLIMMSVVQVSKNTPSDLLRSRIRFVSHTVTFI